MSICSLSEFMRQLKIPSEIRQHGLLNLAILRYSMGHLNEAQKVRDRRIALDLNAVSHDSLDLTRSNKRR